MNKFSLREIRIEKKMTQEDLAVEVGVTRQHIGLIENKTANPSPAIAKKIANALDFPWTRFYEEEEGEDSDE